MRPMPRCPKREGGKMFERFTAKARAVVTAAVDEAQDAGVRYVGTEHLLMAMLAIGERRRFRR